MGLKLSSLIFEAPALSIPLNCLSGFSLLKKLLSLQVHRSTSTEENKNKDWTSAFFRNFLEIAVFVKGGGNAWATTSWPTQWLIQMNNKEKTVSCFQDSWALELRHKQFPVRARPCQEEDGKPETGELGELLRGCGREWRKGWAHGPACLFGIPALMLISHRMSGKWLNTVPRFSHLESGDKYTLLGVVRKIKMS